MALRFLVFVSICFAASAYTPQAPLNSLSESPAYHYASTSDTIEKPEILMEDVQQGEHDDAIQKAEKTYA